jgi:type I restriction enzyme S subunit
MNAERLLAHFEQISEAPDAIARLRRFILDLAVRGKLVEQNPEDEPADELFCRYLEKRIDLVSQGKIRRPKPSSPIRDEDLPINLPRGWTWARFNEIGNLSGGMTPSMGRPDYWDGNIVWLSPKDIKSDEVSESELKLSELGLSECRLELYPPGCLFIVARSGILKRILPVSINRVPAAANQDMKVLTPFVQGQERYLQIMLRGLTDFVLTSLVKTGTTVQSLKYGEFAEQPFPIPPLAEQHRIVAKVDELMALCDQLEASRQQREQTRERLVAASLQRLNQPAEDPASFRQHAQFALQTLPSLTTTPAQIKQLRQTILNLAVRGKLVEQDPEDEPAEFSLPVVSRKNRGGIEHSAEITYCLPPGWTWRAVSAIAETVTDGEHATPKRISEPDVPLVTAKNVREGYMDYSTTDWVSRETALKAWSRCRPQVGDLLMVCVGATTGRLTVLREARDMVLVRSVALIRPSIIADSDYLEHAIRSPVLQSQIWASVKAAAQPCLYLNRINSLLIPLPPLAEQHRIVAKVDELMALCDHLEQQLSQADQQRRRLLEAVLAEALAEPEPGLEGLVRA